MQDTSQIIVKEIESIEALNNFLVNDICNRVDEVNARFRGFINMMGQTGIHREECSTFANEYYAVDEYQFATLYNQIENNDMTVLRLYVEQLVRQYEAATGSSYGVVSLSSPSHVPTQTPSYATQRRGTIQDYQVQIAGLCDFMNYLVSERDQLQETIRRYEYYCNNMVDNGVPIQIVNHYIPNCAQPNVAQINRIISHIQYDDYKQLTGIYNEVASSLNGLGLSPDRSPRSM